MKDEGTVGGKTARNGHKMAIHQLLFFCELAKVARGLWVHFRPISHGECTEVRFASFLSGGFIIVIVVNPPERKLAKHTSVEWHGKY